jgi:DNA-binding response OmpR family regulator
LKRDLILVVDDVADIRNFVRDALTPEGFDVIEAADGHQALKLISEKKPSVVILDLSIGQPDGFEVCREIRKTSICSQAMFKRWMKQCAWLLELTTT